MSLEMKDGDGRQEEDEMAKQKELDTDIGSLLREKEKLMTNVKRLEDALVRLEHFSGTLQRKLGGYSMERGGSCGVLFGKAGVLTLGTESQLQVMKDLTRENICLKQAVAGIDRSRPEAVEKLMVIDDLQQRNVVLQLEVVQLHEELDRMKRFGDGIESSEDASIVIPYLNRIHELEMRIEVKQNVLTELLDEVERHKYSTEEQTRWARKEDMYNKTISNLKKMVGNMRQQMLAQTNMLQSSTFMNSELSGMQHRKQMTDNQASISMHMFNVSVQTEITMEELGKLETEICSVQEGQTDWVVGRKGPVSSVDDGLDKQASLSIGEILLLPDVHHDSASSSVAGDGSMRDSEPTSLSILSARVDSGIEQSELESNVDGKCKQVTDSFVTEDAIRQHKVVEKKLLEMSQQISTLQKNNQVCHARILELEEANSDLEKRCLLPLGHKAEVEVLQRDRELVGELLGAVDDGSRGQTREELEEQVRQKEALEFRVNELVIQVQECTSLKQHLRTTTRDLQSEQQAHEMTKRMVASKEVEREAAINEMQKYKQQRDKDIERLSGQLQQLTVENKAADVHNRDLQLEINQLVDNQERLQKENTEGLKQVQYLYSQVMAKTEEVQKSQRVVEEVRRQMREMKQERQVSSYSHAEGVDKVSSLGMYQHTKKGSEDDPRAVPHHQLKQIPPTAGDYHSPKQPTVQLQGSHLYDPINPTSVLGHGEYSQLQEWMKRERISSTIRGRTVRSSQQPSNSLVTPTSASLYSSNPLPINVGNSSLQPSKQSAQSVPVQPGQVKEQQHPQKRSTDKALECPRCQKPFLAADFSNYREHLEQCLT